MKKWKLLAILLLAFVLTACSQINDTLSSGGDGMNDENTSNQEGQIDETNPNNITGNVSFGAYPQSTEEAEPIEWIVLNDQDDRVLLLANNCIASLPWHNTHKSVTWDHCDLRAWLNGDFLREAFTEEEQEQIFLSDLDNSDDFGYGTPVGEDTQDKVFLLSTAEVEKYLLEDNLRTVKPTAYAISHGAYTNGSGECAWWLRSPGMTETSPAYLSSGGSLGSRAHEVDETIIGVRPAMWVRKDALHTQSDELPDIASGQAADAVSRYVDQNGDTAVIPEEFKVSEKEDEQTVSTGLVVIGPDGSEFVWIPITQTPLEVCDFGSYVSWGATFNDYWDETDLESYREMVTSTEKYGGFYMGRYEASLGGGDSISNYVPASKQGAEPWVRFDPADTDAVCQNLYADNESIQGFFPWGINYDTTLQWLIDSGCKTENEVAKDSTSWGNYSDDSFSPGADGSSTGVWEEAKANNIYDLAGNNWEWTQERHGSGSFVMRGGGYNLMGGACPGSSYPAALRDPLPGSDRHPNVAFRVALYLK